MTDTWPTMARFSVFPPDSDNPFSSSPAYSNGNPNAARTMSDQVPIDTYKERHSRLMGMENEKNKLIEVPTPQIGLAGHTDSSRTLYAGSNLLKSSIKNHASIMIEKSDIIGKGRCERLSCKTSCAA
jgi:hypothetical protein